MPLSLWSPAGSSSSLSGSMACDICDPIETEAPGR
jgi:hypothetical protein